MARDFVTHPDPNVIAIETRRPKRAAFSFLDEMAWALHYLGTRRASRPVRTRKRNTMTTIRVNLTNNSTARTWGGARTQDVMVDATRGTIRHNGGKTVIVTCDDSDETEMRAALESSNAVASVE